MRQKYIFAAAAMVMASACTAPYCCYAEVNDEALVVYGCMKFQYTNDEKTELRLVDCNITADLEEPPLSPVICVPGVIGDAKVTSIDPYAFHSPDGTNAHVLIPRSTGCDDDMILQLEKNSGDEHYFRLCGAATDGLVFEESTEVPGELILSECYISGDIVVPEKVDGMTVTGIFSSAFSRRLDIRDVTLPDSICYMARCAFELSSVRNVNIPKRLHVIPSGAFAQCEQLENVELHENIIRIYAGAFFECSYQPPAEYEDRYWSVGYEDSDISLTGSVDDWRYTINGRQGSSYVGLTQYTGSDTDITVPTTLLGEEVYSCVLDLPTCVESVTVPEDIGLVDISKLGDNPLRKLTLLSPDTFIKGTFGGSAIEEAVISLNTTYSSQLEVPVRMFDSCKRLKTVTFLNAADELVIENNAFTDCAELTTVDLPDNCVSAYVELSAFNGCYSLTDLGDIGRLDSVGTESRAFSGTGITSADLKNWKIGSYAFSDCKALGDITLTDSAAADSAFQNCTSLKSVKLNRVSLADKSFDNCPQLENVDFGEDVTSNHSFMSCPNLFTLNGKAAYDEKTKDFTPECSELVYRHFSGADDVGFINQFVKDRVKAAVAEAVTDDMTDMEKIKALHDWLCRNAEYSESDIYDRSVHTDASVFLSGTTVCEGYARAFDLLLQEAGIESCCVGNPDHEWNVVRVGGQYFHIDTTWDDKPEISYKWFMKTDKELKAAGGYHAKWSLSNTSSIHRACFDKLPQCSYSVGDVNADGEKGVADLVSLSSYLLAKTELTEGNGALSDLNFDGTVDTFDLVFLRKQITE